MDDVAGLGRIIEPFSLSRLGSIYLFMHASSAHQTSSPGLVLTVDTVPHLTLLLPRPYIVQHPRNLILRMRRPHL
jgi:hypothetical protein